MSAALRQAVCGVLRQRLAEKLARDEAAAKSKVDEFLRDWILGKWVKQS